MGLPDLRCASMPFADEVIFNFWPGVAADEFRALEALSMVAAVVDMEGQNNSAGKLRGPRRWEMERGKGRLLGARAAAQDAQGSTRGDEQQEKRPQGRPGGGGQEDGEAVGKLPDAVVSAAMPSGSPRLKQRRAGGS